MSLEISVQIETDKIIQQVNRESERRVKIAVAEVERQVKLNLKTPSRTHGRSTPGDYPHSRSGMLWKSIFSGLIDQFTGFVGVRAEAGPQAGVRYGRPLHQGEIIKSPSGKYLAIPISDKARHWMEDGNSARDFPIPLRRILRPGKRTLLVQITTPGGKVRKKSFIIHFVLTPFVVLRERPFLRRTLDEMQPRIRQILEGT